jgi:hypothetical protein
MSGYAIWQGTDPQYKASWEAAMESLRTRAQALEFSEQELVTLTARRLQTVPETTLARVRILMDCVPGLRGQAERALQWLPTRQKRLLLAAVAEAAPAEEPPEPDDGLPANMWDAWDRPPGDATEITPPSVWWKSPSDPMLHIVTVKPKPEPELAAAGSFRWRNGVMTITGPALTASARRRARERAALRPKTRKIPAYTGGRGFNVKVVGDDPHRWRVLDQWGVPVDGVKVTGSGSLVASAPEPLSTYTLPSGDTRLDKMLAYSMGTMDLLSAVARKELEVEEHQGAFEKLAAEIKKLADRPQPKIEVHPTPVHVEAPIVNPTPVTVDLSTLKPPDVYVTVEPPPRRGVRVEVDAVTGEKTYVPFDLPEEGEEA